MDLARDSTWLDVLIIAVVLIAMLIVGMRLSRRL